MNSTAPIVQMIPIREINVLNPRNRSKITFNNIISNISTLGLKKPVTVAPRPESVDGKPYDLICGQGRLEAYVVLGQSEIPAIVKEASREECFLMSLVENVARRKRSSNDLLSEISNLRSRGYSTSQIARKIDITESYVAGLFHLLNRGEARLLDAVEKGRIPLSMAIEIASSDEAGTQQILCEAYEDKLLRGKKLIVARRIIELRKAKGKGLAPALRDKKAAVSSADALVRAYRQEVSRQQLLIKRSQLTENRLLLIASALRTLLRDDNFVTLLRAEGLDTMPTYLAERIHGREKG